MAVLKQAKAGTPVPQLCRGYGMSSASFYKWRGESGGMGTSMIIRFQAFEAENHRLKKMYAEERLKVEIAREAIEKRGKGTQFRSGYNIGITWPFHNYLTYRVDGWEGQPAREVVWF